MIEWIIHLRAPVSRDAWADGRVGRKGVRRARPSGRQRETPQRGWAGTLLGDRLAAVRIAPLLAASSIR